MATDLRKTGIDVISQMPWGTHFCLFYETKEDLLDTLVPYFKAGLEDNEYCVWVVADPLTEEDAWRALSQTVPALERHRSNQSIELLPARDWYLNVGHFELDRVTSAWNRKLTQALARGYAGMRVSGDTLWLEKKSWKSFLEYENQLDKSITDRPMTVLCTYQLTSSGAAEILDVARSHQFTLARRGGAWEVIETPELKEAKAEIKSLNEQLERRVVERTVQLAASNEQLKLELIERKQAEALLHTREQEFRAFVENAPDQIIRYDKEFRRTYVNPAVSAAYGLPKEAFIGKPVGSVVEDAGLKTDIDEVAAIRQRIKSVFDTGQATEFEVTFPSPGDRRTYWTRMYPEFDPNGVVINVLAISRDITERKQAEEALRRSEEKFKAVFESAPVGIAVLDQERKIVDMNPILEQMMRINKEGLLAGAYRSRTYIRPDGTPKPFSEFASERAIHENRPIYGVETGIVLEHGEIIWVQVNAVPLGLPDASAVVITQDITERKRAGEALRRSKSNYRVLAENSVQGIAIFQEPRMVYANPALSRITGYTVEELKSMSAEQIIALTHPSDRAIAEERVRKRMEGEAVSPSIELRILRKDGSTGWVQTFDNPIEYNGRPAFLSTTIDITERKRAEEELRESEDNFSAAFRASPVALVIAALNGKLVEMNQAFCELLGYSREELLGRTSTDIGILSTVSSQEWVEALARAGGVTTNLELNFRVRNGIFRTTLTSVEPITFHGLPHRLATILDITERKQAETAIRSLLQISEKLHATLDIDALLDSLVIEAMQLTDAEIGWSGLRTEEGMVCHTHVARDLQVVSFPYIWPPEVGLPGWVLVHKVPYVMNDAESDEMIIPEIRERFGVKAAIDTPILDAQGEVIGFFEVNNKKNGAGFSESDVEKLVAISRIASIALQNAMLLKAANEQHEQLRALSTKLVEVQEAERRALTTELHDRVGQNLTGLSINLQNMKALLSDEMVQTLAAKFDDAQALVEHTTRQIRDIMAELHPPELEDYGPAAALETYAERAASRGNLELIADLPDLAPPPLPSDVRIALFRAAQEAITNVLKYADATRMEVSLEESDGRIRLRVEDDGKGFEPEAATQNEAQTWGLKIMRERIESIGGKVQIESEPGEGTRVVFEIERPS